MNLREIVVLLQASDADSLYFLVKSVAQAGWIHLVQDSLPGVPSSSQHQGHQICNARTVFFFLVATAIDNISRKIITGMRSSNVAVF